MQRLAGDFLVGARTLSMYTPEGNIVELYQLPNGQWQYGKGRDAIVITSLDQLVLTDATGKPTIDKDSLESIKAWIRFVEERGIPAPVQQGRTPVLAGQSARDQLSQAISQMPEEVVNRLLTAIVQTLGPVADSITQGPQINSHGDGYGQGDVHAPGPVRPFQLPPGARWVDETRPASGYVTFPDGVTDLKGKQVSSWHPTPEFDVLTRQPDPIPVAETAFEQELAEERGKHESVAAGRASGRRRK